MNLLIVLLAIIILYRVQYAGKGNYFDYLSIENTNSIKAIASIVVVMHHIQYWGNVGNVIPFSTIFVRIGYVCVGVFFFISGYGLMYGLTHKKDYLKGFIPHRMTKLLLPYLVANLVYIPYKLGFSLVSGFGEVIHQYLQGQPVVDNSWYVIAMVYFYLVFWVVASLIKDTNRIWIYVGVFTLLYIYLTACVLEYRGNWYKSVVAFPIGILFYTVRNRFDTTIRKHFLGYCTIIVILTCIVGIILNVIYHHVGTSSMYYTVGYYYMLAILLVALLICQKFKPRNKVLDFYGKISFELYLMHGLMLIIFRNDIYLYIKNDLVYALLVLVSSTVVAYLMHQLDSLILKKLIPAKPQKG